jgi:hypothetical protein
MALHTATPLTAQQLTALARLQNRPTLYEIEIVAPDGRKALLAYASRKTGAGLRDAVYQRAQPLLTFLGAPQNARIEPTKGCRYHGHTVTGGGLVRFSNRTKRDVIMEGTSLPYVAQEA